MSDIKNHINNIQLMKNKTLYMKSLDLQNGYFVILKIKEDYIDEFSLIFRYINTLTNLE